MFFSTCTILITILIDSLWEEQEDAVIVDSKVFHKPFVEKPISAEDHNVHIYFPSAAGGGTQQLFRKVSRCGVCVHVCTLYIVHT